MHRVYPIYRKAFDGLLPTPLPPSLGRQIMTSGGKKAILQIVLDDMDRLLFGGRVFALRRDFFPLVANGSSRSCVGTTLAANNADKEPQAPDREGR
jgi:hypothetical protein